MFCNHMEVNKWHVNSNGVIQIWVNNLLKAVFYKELEQQLVAYCGDACIQNCDLQNKRLPVTLSPCFLLSQKREDNQTDSRISPKKSAEPAIDLLGLGKT